MFDWPVDNLFIVNRLLNYLFNVFRFLYDLLNFVVNDIFLRNLNNSFNDVISNHFLFNKQFYWPFNDLLYPFLNDLFNGNFDWPLDNVSSTNFYFFYKFLFSHMDFCWKHRVILVFIYVFLVEFNDSINVDRVLVHNINALLY